MHGGVPKTELKGENLKALKKGMANLERHLGNIQKYGVPAVVAINRFIDDTKAEVELVRKSCKALGAEVIECTHWADGGAGTEQLAKTVVSIIEKGKSKFKVLYPDSMSLWDKTRTIAQKIYGADDIIADDKVRKQYADLQNRYPNFPICMAKTQYSFSTDPALMGAPSGHVVPVRELRLSAGAEFIVAVCGDIMIMPGLPKVPAAENISVNKKGQIEGLF